MPRPVPVPAPQQVQPYPEFVRNALRRAGFGPTLAQLSQIQTSSALSQWITDQLNLAGPDEPIVAQLIASLPAASPALSTTRWDQSDWKLTDLVTHQLIHQIYSKWQVRERMTFFWQTHFSTQFFKVMGARGITGTGREDEKATWLLYHENKAFRDNALGTFRDLLQISIDSPAMRIYLNLVSNIAIGPNEDYSRELNELYGPGPEDALTGIANYDARDIDLIARALTGLDVEFVVGTGNVIVGLRSIYDPVTHDFEEKANIYQGNNPALIPYTISRVPQGSLRNAVTFEREVRAFLDHLVAQDATADFICRKLMKYFIGDDSDATLLANCKAQWNTVGNITAILDVLLRSTTFQNSTPVRSDAELPLETMVSNARIWGASPLDAAQNADAGKLEFIRTSLALLEQKMFRYPSPDGYPLASDRQLGTSLYATRIRRLTDSLAPIPGSNPTDLTFDAARVIRSQIGVPSGVVITNTPVQVAASLLNLLFSTKYTIDDRRRVVYMLGRDANDQPSPFSGTQSSLNAAQQDVRLREVAALASCMPQGVTK